MIIEVGTAMNIRFAPVADLLYGYQASDLDYQTRSTLSGTGLDAGERPCIPWRRGRNAITDVHVITGFLGSGKTTLVARLLQDPALSDTAVIVNEFGEVGLDGPLIEAATGQDVVMLARGCLCCALDGTLAATLEGMASRRAAGLLPPFRRVVVETSGLADPTPVLQSVLDRPAVMQGYRLGHVVTVVDATSGAANLDRHAEAVRQVAVADTLLLSKTDLAGPVPDLMERLRALNPRAAFGLHAEATAELFDEPPAPIRPRFAVDAGHTAGIATTVVELPGPVPFAALADWLGGLAAAHGPALLRVKGVVAVPAGPLLVQGVQHVFHPPRLLPAWPPGTRSALVFILDGLDPAVIHAGAARLLEREAA